MLGAGCQRRTPKNQQGSAHVNLRTSTVITTLLVGEEVEILADPRNSSNNLPTYAEALQPFS
jgi:hypothetical protein